ncbi:MAG TPA: hypothetical protein VK712_00575 [Verrucomicrobiae bacterium]|jgi:hypothetical protein|nr:hypothetical protein [Verrucomicrobiae bacterium]
MGKATELDDFLDKRVLTTEEIEWRHGSRPKLRLRPEVMAQAIAPNAQVSDVLARLADADGENRTALHDPESGMMAIAVPLELYLELVTSYIKEQNLSEGKTDGRTAPTDATLAALGIEQVDPQASWSGKRD